MPSAASARLATRWHRLKLSAICLVLVAATLTSFVSSRSSPTGKVPVLITILALMYLKSRLVLFGFMEVGRGPPAWRAFFEIWLLAVAGEIGWFLF